MNRLHKPQNRLDPVVLQNLELVTFDKPSIPSFAEDGYVQSYIANGWHVMVRDPEDSQVTDHMFLVNQHTGQQFQLKLVQRDIEYQPFIAVIDELDMFDNAGGLLFQPEPGSSITIKWTCIDKRGVGSFANTASHYYYDVDTDTFINVHQLLNPLMDSIWYNEYSKTLAPPSLEKRSSIWNLYRVAVETAGDK